jgi:hypothetical protein
MIPKFKIGDLVIELNNYNYGKRSVDRTYEGIIKDISIEKSTNIYFYNLDIKDYPDWLNHWVEEDSLILHPRQSREEILNILGID